MASAQNYINSLRSPPPARDGYGGGGGYTDPSRPLAPVPADTYNGGFSPAQAQTYSQGDEFANDPNAPSWLREAPAPSATAQSQFFDPSTVQGASTPAPKNGCCHSAGPKFFSCLCYLFGILGGIVGIVIERRDVYILANAWQSTFVGIPCVIICFIFVWLPLASKILWIIYAAICVALTIACVIVPYPSIFHLPFCIGNWAIKRAQYTVAANAHRYGHHHQRTVTETTTLTSNVYV